SHFTRSCGMSDAQIAPRNPQRSLVRALRPKCFLPLFAFELYAGGCDSAVVKPIVPRDSSVTTLDVTRPCLQTHEFGNYGCSRTVVVLAPPPDPLPSLYRLDVRARWANSPTTTAALASPSEANPLLGPVALVAAVVSP